jgi:GH18 family chitinase
MASTKENRQAFIKSLGKFLEKWPFTAVELHWQWPGAPNRGGRPDDGHNYVELVKEMRAIYNPNMRIAVVLPGQSEYQKYMHPKGMEASLDWFTVLAHDFHGSLDRKLSCLSEDLC